MHTFMFPDQFVRRADRQHLCCNNHLIIAMNDPDTDYDCCGNQMFDVDREICCGETIFPKQSHGCCNTKDGPGKCERILVVLNKEADRTLSQPNHRIINVEEYGVHLIWFL